MPATCSRCSSTPGVQVVLSGHKHVPYVWRLEDMYVANAGTVSSLRVRGYTKPCYNVLEFDGGQVAHPPPFPVRREPRHGPLLARGDQFHREHELPVQERTVPVGD